MPLRRILVRGVNWLGDAVMTTPALLRLREAQPEAKISLLSPEKLTDLWKDHPAVDETLGFRPQESVWQISRRIRAGRFDAAVIFPNSLRSGLEVWFGRVPRRVGYSGEGRAILLTDALGARPGAVRMHKRSEPEIKTLIAAPVQKRQRFPSSTHHIHHYLHLVRAFGASVEPVPPLIAIGASEKEVACARYGIPQSEPIFCINPGAEYGPAKRWPGEAFAATSADVERVQRGTWVLVGTQKDAPLCEDIAARIRTVVPISKILNLAGKTTLRELAAVLAVAKFLLTNDSGPMHLAAAVGTPVIGIFGSTSFDLTGPGLPGDTNHRLLFAEVGCAPCFRRECPIDLRCLKGVSPVDAARAAMEILSKE